MTEPTPPKRGEPVAVYLRSGHIVKVGRGFDEEAFARWSPYSRAPEVLGLPPSVRIYFATGLVDMRNGVDGLRTIVEQVLRRNPNERHLFVFVGKRRDMLKILFWDKNGYVVYFKRLERGRFQLPVVDEKRVKVEMEAAQLAMLLDGNDLNAMRLARWTPEGIDKDSGS